LPSCLLRELRVKTPQPTNLQLSPKNPYLRPLISNHNNYDPMAISTELLTRSESKCELCFSDNELQDYLIPPKSADILDNQIALCLKCKEEITTAETLDTNHWRCLNESMWSQIPAVQVMAYRMLERLNTESWAQDLLGMIYLDDETLEWAKSGGDAALVHKDSNGHVLQSGDSVTLIQDLNVKGSSLTAKRGTAVRRIRLDPNNAEYIEGKVDGQHIVILTKFVKKSN